MPSKPSERRGIKDELYIKEYNKMTNTIHSKGIHSKAEAWCVFYTLLAILSLFLLVYTLLVVIIFPIFSYRAWKNYKKYKQEVATESIHNKNEQSN